MKAILLALFVGLLMVGCEESSTPSTPSDPVDSPKAIDLDDKETRDKIIAEAIDGNKLKKGGRGQERKLLYAPNEQTPYTGWVKSMHDDEQIEFLGQFKDGKQDGLMLTWHKNGQKWREANFKDGKRDGLATEWDENGQKKAEGNFKDDKQDGRWIYYNGDGTEVGYKTFKDGEVLGMKEKQTQNRPGNYDSLKTASDRTPFPPLPESVTKKIPHGIVVYFDQNESITVEHSTGFTRKWIIETAGARLFILVEETPEVPSQYHYSRASEFYLKINDNHDQERLEEKLDPERYQIIGKNSKSGEWILQIKDISPPGIRSSLKELALFKPVVEGVRLSPWNPRN